MFCSVLYMMSIAVPILVAFSVMEANIMKYGIRLHLGQCICENEIQLIQRCLYIF